MVQKNNFLIMTFIALFFLSISFFQRLEIYQNHEIIKKLKSHYLVEYKAECNNEKCIIVYDKKNGILNEKTMKEICKNKR